MGSNSFGNCFRFTTWGESHGPAIGVVIDGCPAGLPLSETDFQQDLRRRAPGLHALVSPRQEKDEPQILSGVFDGKTTGAPIAVVIDNQDVRSEPYHTIKNLLRPGHANFTYLTKYGIFDHRGGGRSSARETACRVIAGVVAKKLIQQEGMQVHAYIRQMGEIEAVELSDLKKREKSPVYCPDLEASQKMCAELQRVKAEGDSLGAVVEFVAQGLPVGLGEPIYDKLQARLAYALMSIPATKGFEMGEGFSAANRQGSEFNDRFIREEGRVATSTNHAGGTLGGISTGMPVVGRVAFKPTSSIFKPQETLTTQGEKSVLTLPADLRLDPCVGLRGVVVVEAMVAVVLADLWLMNRCARL